MNTRPDRRTFLAQQGLLAVGFVGAGAFGQTAAPVIAQTPGGTSWPSFPQQDPALAREIVGASHRSVTRVHELLKAHPALASASYDWGFGDWESALGAASHVGNREIAELLLEHGARLDIFAATMLGMTDVVMATLAARPALARTRGPHGISIVAHALAGNHEALANALRGFAGAEVTPPEPLTKEAMATYVGAYARDGNSGAVTVSETRFGLAIRGDTGGDCRLIRTSEHAFHPAGAANVRVTFTVQDGRATRVDIVEDAWIVGATRV